MKHPLHSLRQLAGARHLWCQAAAMALLAAAATGAQAQSPASAASGAAPASASNAASPAGIGSSQGVAGELKPCRLKGVEHGALCGVLKRPLNPAQPQGTQIDLHFAVMPALARNKLPDPVFFFAGGPGQSAIDLAGPVSAMLSRFGNRRDIVLIDQRGTGRSASLMCDDAPAALPLREALDTAFMHKRLDECLAQLRALPHGDLRFFTTTIAMADADAVREHLQVPQINLVGGSYGTRAVLEYQRQFPQRVRRAIIDGVAPPDMALPLTFSPDAQAAFDALLASCETGGGDAACAQRHPNLRAQWQQLWASLPREVRLRHPHTGAEETLLLTRDALANAVRQPLYVPALASALPHAVAEAAEGRFTALVGLSSAMGSGRQMRMAAGMHFSVICAEDMPRLTLASEPAGRDFGDSALNVYRSVCARWPRGDVPASFYTVPPAPAPVLVLSGGIDPVTPPRHGQRITQMLGNQARHVVVPHAGHGVMALGCMRDVLFRFVDAKTAAEAMAVKTDCAQAMPRPPAYSPFRAALGSQKP
jgi:pimeloyl-ACP methyl ester carboxylesterase